MSVNKYRPHLLFLPEDDANRDLANGFILEFNTRQLQILPEVGGWRIVIETFKLEHIPALRSCSERRIALLIDFDEDSSRRETLNRDIPAELKNRVFLLGTKSEPEKLRSAGLGSYESIGRRMAQECREGTHSLWQHELLEGNLSEVNRLRKSIRSFLV